MKDLYENTIIRVQTAGGMTNNIETRTGICQGDSLSPVPFNFIMKRLIDSVKSMNKYKMADRNLTVLYVMLMMMF